MLYAAPIASSRVFANGTSEGVFFDHGVSEGVAGAVVVHGGLYQKHPFGSRRLVRLDAPPPLCGVVVCQRQVRSRTVSPPSLHANMGRTKMTFWSVFVTAAANLRLGRIWIRRQQRKHHREQGPAISPAMRQAAQARQRTMGRRRRQEREKGARARGRPPD